MKMKRLKKNLNQRETAYPNKKELDILQIDKILTTLLDKYHVETQVVILIMKKLDLIYIHKLIKQWIVSKYLMNRKRRI